jgi:hypothetical protein
LFLDQIHPALEKTPQARHPFARGEGG